MSNFKDLVFFAALVLGVPVLALLTANFRWLRDALFFSIVVGTAKIDWLDINFLSRELYRGTTRGMEITFVDLLVLSLLLAILLNAGRDNFRFYWPAGLTLLCIYFLYCGLNIMASTPQLYGLFELTKILRGIIVFITAAYYIRSEREIHLLFAALLVAGLAVGMYSAYERYWLHFHRVLGPFPHPNILSQYCCMLSPSLLIYGMTAQRPFKIRVVFMIGAAFSAGAVVLSMSRMGNFILVILLAIALAASLRMRFNQTNIAIAALVILVAFFGGIKASNTLMARYGEATLSDEYGQETSGRGVYLRLARAMLAEDFFGVGLNNWSYWVSANAERFNMPYRPYPDGALLSISDGSDPEWAFSQAAPAHNLLAITAGELGWPGLLLMLALWGQWAYFCIRLLQARFVPWSWFGLTTLLTLLAVYMQNMTEFVFRLTPVLFLTMIMLAGVSSMLRNARIHQVIMQQKLFAGNPANGSH